MEIKENLKNRRLHIFDMDGTLVNLEVLNRTSYAQTIDKYFKLSLTHDEYLKYFSGTKTGLAFEFYLRSKNIGNYSLESLIKDFRIIKENSLKNNFEQCVFLIPKAREYLQYLRNENKVIALATSTIRPFTEMILRGSSLFEFFDYMVTAEDVMNGKPDPEIFNLTILKGNFLKKEAVVYEDSRNGIDAARSAQIFCVGIHTEGLNDGIVEQADFVINDYSELL